MAREKEEAEAKVILQYLPAEISMEEIEASIQEAIIAVSAKGLSDSGKVMGKVMLNTRCVISRQQALFGQTGSK